MVKDFELIHDISVLFKKNVILYGAGNIGIRSYRRIAKSGIHIDKFCDSDKKKQGGEVGGLQVIGLDELMKYDMTKLAVIVTSERYLKPIIEDLESAGFWGDIFTHYALHVALYVNIHHNLIESSFRKKFFTWAEKRQNLNRLIDVFGWIQNGTLADGMQMASPDSILVYQPAKVASTTVASSIAQYRKPVFHVHSLENSHLGLENMNVDSYLYSLQIEQPRTEKLKIVTSVREPISREISNFFERLNLLIKPNVGLYELFEQTLDRFYCTHDYLDADDRIVSVIYGGENNIHGYFDWFNIELKKVFGIDIFEYEFDRESGYSVISTDKIDVFIFKVERLNDIYPRLGEFLGIPSFELTWEREASKREYMYLYREFINNFKVSKKLLDIYYNGNEFFDHFYTPAERDGFLQRWKVTEQN